jgi:hypothetical protein
MMKKVICLLILGLVFLRGYGQIKQGSSFNYTFSLHGQTIPMELTVLHYTDTLVLGWKIRGLAGGSYTMLPSGLQHGERMNFIQPLPDANVLLGEKETFCMISADAFKKLVKEHQFVYDNTVYDFKDNEKELLHVVARDETTELWIMNNPAFPLVCKIKGSPLGIDCSLNSFKE